VIEPQSITIDGTQYWYTHYKAPFRQLPGALPGYPIGVPVVDEFGKLLCPYCKPARTFDNMGKHVKAHGSTGAQFKATLGWMSKTPLTSQRWINKRRATEIATGVYAARLARVRQPGFSAAGTQRRPTEQRHAGSPERDNQMGHCRDQIVAVARLLHKGHSLDWPHLEAQGVNKPSVLRHFGSWRAFRQECGWDGNRRYTDAEIILALRDFAARLGHTPTHRDLRGHFPGGHVLINWAGSISEAMRRASLEPNLPSPGRRSANDAESILHAFAVCGSVERTGRLIGSSPKTVQAALDSFGYPFPPFSKDRRRQEWAAEMAKRLAGVAA
jgi:hypothetical protein